jgi:hypothetical protein
MQRYVCFSRPRLGHQETVRLIVDEDRHHFPHMTYKACSGARGRRIMETSNFAEQWRSVQKMFLPTSAMYATSRENAGRFWENQDKILDQMQALSNAWFDRRRTGTHSARAAAERMCGTETIVDFAQAYQDWARGVFERVMADGLSWQQHLMAATGAFGSPPIAPSAGEKERKTEPERSEATAPARSKAAA